MPLINKTRNKTIMDKVRIAEDFFSQAKGLMFEDRKKVDYALVFPMALESRHATSVHMLFVFFPIDIVFLDSNKKVVDVRRNVPSFLPYLAPKKPAKYFIEMPVGKSDGIGEGDFLEWN